MNDNIEQSGLTLSSGVNIPLTDTIYYRPDFKKNVVINPLERGWNVVVGCSTLAFTDLDELMEKLKMYLEDPKGTEELFNKKELFIKTK